MWKKIEIGKAVGMQLAHDITRVVPGQFKGVAFRRGHLIKEEDIPKFLDLGKRHVYILKLKPSEVHEDEAARCLARAIAGPGITLKGPSEGRIHFRTVKAGVLKVNVRALEKVNNIGSIIAATLHHNSFVQKGMTVGGTRAIPLALPVAYIRKAEEICRKGEPILKVLPLRRKKVGILVTGNEIFEKRIPDRSSGVIAQKIKAFGSRVIESRIIPDNPERIAEEIREMNSVGCQVIFVTGGLSVDPDDVTLEGIQRSGAKVIFHGVPVLPGSMSAYALLGRTVILGTPACVIHDRTTALDIFLPRIFADDPLSASEVAGLGHGGFCLKCSTCRYPVCPFGKGNGLLSGQK